MMTGRCVVVVLTLIAVGGKFPTDLPTYRLTDYPSYPPDTTITIRASSSTLAFEPSELAVKQGTRVRIRFVNAGTLPHNFVLVRREEDIDTLATIAAKIEGSFIPLELKDRMIAWTPLATPGQTVEVEFVVPPPGVYPYVCLMTGHNNSMMGTLRSLR
jgi:plastocyanin